MSAMFGFLQGYMVCEAENVSLEMYVQCVKNLLPALERGFARICRKLQEKDYVGDQASLEAWTAGPRMLISWGRDHRAHHSTADAYLDLMDRAIKAGKGQADFAYLYEVLKAG